MESQKQTEYLEPLIFQLDHLKTYHKAILNVLDRIDLNTDDEALKQDLKLVYQLLTILTPKREQI